MDQMSPISGSELPKPAQEIPQQSGDEYAIESIERVVPAPERSGERISQAASAVAQAAADPVVIPIQPISQSNDPIQQSSNGQSTNPVIADDADVIEKEWVEKAKSIVAKTKDNPHEQSVELTNFRHDYMKKRYGKEIKLPDERAA